MVSRSSVTLLTALGQAEVGTRRRFKLTITADGGGKGGTTALVLHALADEISSMRAVAGTRDSL